MDNAKLPKHRTLISCPVLMPKMQPKYNLVRSSATQFWQTRLYNMWKHVCRVQKRELRILPLFLCIMYIIDFVVLKVKVIQGTSYSFFCKKKWTCSEFVFFVTCNQFFGETRQLFNMCKKIVPLALVHNFGKPNWPEKQKKNIWHSWFFTCLVGFGLPCFCYWMMCFATWHSSTSWHIRNCAKQLRRFINNWKCKTQPLIQAPKCGARSNAKFFPRL